MMEESAVIRYGVRDEKSILVPMTRSYDVVQCIVTEPSHPLELHVYSTDSSIIISSDRYNIIEFPDPLPLCLMETANIDCKVYVEQDEPIPKIAIYGSCLSAEMLSDLVSQPYSIELPDGRTLSFNRKTRERRASV